LSVLFIQCPDDVVQIPRKADPEEIWEEEHGGETGCSCKEDHGDENREPQRDNVDKREKRIMLTEKEEAPQNVQDKLDSICSKRKLHFFTFNPLLQHEIRRESHERVEARPDRTKYRRRRIPRRLHKRRIPHRNRGGREERTDRTRENGDGETDGEGEVAFGGHIRN